MRKLILTWCAALAIGPMFAETIDIATTADLASLSSGTVAENTYRLTADLDLSSWESIDFNATLDGNGHSVTGLSVPLFETLSGTVRNLTIDGSVGGVNKSITIPARTDFGLLALTATAARVENSSVKGYSLENRQPSDKTLPQNSIGFLVACAFDGCVFSNDITIEGCAATMGGDLAFGGLVGSVRRTDGYSDSAVVTFSGCVNNATVTSVVGCSAVGNGALGGILGRDVVGGVAARPCTLVLTDCVNNGSWNGSGSSGNVSFGGIVGQYAGGTASTSYNTLKMTGCANHGNMTATAVTTCNNMRLGGLIGMCGRYSDSIEIDKCLNDGNINIPATSVGGNTHGGFIGYVYDFAKNAHLTVRNSVSRGDIYIPSSATKSNNAGGLVGYSSLSSGYGGVNIHVENSSFAGTMTAKVTSLLIAQFGSTTTINSTLKFTIDNCWFAEECVLVDTSDTIGANYSASNVVFHEADSEATENTALALVATSNEDYVSWQVNSKSGNPEPILGATRYVVVFKDYDGTMISMQQVEEGSAAEAPANPTRTGYSFAGWDPSDFSSVASNMTIVATYEQSAAYRNVTFKDYDGTELKQVAVSAGEMIPADDAPPATRVGYGFVGWLLDGQIFDLETAVTDDIVLIASYQINVYDVVFFDWNMNQLGETQKVTYLEAAIEPSLPAIPEGKVFWKWSESFSSVTDDLEVKAVICEREQQIDSAESFASLINADTPSVVNFSLTADVDLTGWTGVDFSSGLDGQGHVISGLSVPLFNAVTRATIKNLVISNSTLNTVQYEESIGLVARTVGDSSLISNVVTTADCTIGAGANVSAGGIVGVMANSAVYEGENSSWIVDCTNHAAVAKTETDSNSRGSLAGIVGRIESQGATGQPYVTNGVLRCANYGPITCNFNGGRLAGLVGKILTINSRALSAVLDSGNYTNLIGVTSSGSTDYKRLFAGGIVANISTASFDVLIDGCVNRGEVSVGFEPDGQETNLDKTAAGVVAYLDSLSKNSSLTIRNSANYGNVTGENAAGFAGVLGANANFAYTKVCFENCANYGAVNGRTLKAQAVGRWVKPITGFTRELRNCFLLADSANELPVVGGTEEGFEQIDVFTNLDEGYTAETALATLNSSLEGNEWLPWRILSLDDVAVPQIKRFGAMRNAFVIYIR